MCQCAHVYKDFFFKSLFQMLNSSLHGQKFGCNVTVAGKRFITFEFNVINFNSSCPRSLQYKLGLHLYTPLFACHCQHTHAFAVNKYFCKHKQQPYLACIF